MVHPRPPHPILQNKTVDFIGIQTWIVKVEGERADHFTTSMVQNKFIFKKTFIQFRTQ